MPSEQYYKKADAEAGEHLMEVLRRLETLPPEAKKAIDLGCGNGRDTLAMLEKGWQVLAVDVNPDALAHLEQRVDPALKNKLTLLPASFEQVMWWENVMLVNASYSLPFCPPGAFPEVWRQLTQSLKKGGVFYGHLFGVHEGWKSLILHTKAEVEALLEDFAIESLVEAEFDRLSMSGVEKHWHVFEIWAVKW